MVRLHTNVWNSLKLLDRFIFTEWKFNNPRTLELAKSMSAADRAKYNIDLAELEWEEYFISLTLGVRRYLNHEHPRNMEAARGKDTL